MLVKHATYDERDEDQCNLQDEQQYINEDIDEFFEQNEIVVKAQRNFSSKNSTNLLAQVRHRESAKEGRDFMESLLVPPRTSNELGLTKQGSFQNRKSQHLLEKE